MEQEESEFNADFIRHMLPKLEWGALLAGAAALGVADGLPQAVPPAADDDDEFLQLLHLASTIMTCMNPPVVY